MTALGAIDAIAGRLIVRPGTGQPLSGGRPIVTPSVMARLTRGLAADELPARLGQLFSLCGTAHRMTARRAVRAARAETAGVRHAAAESPLLELWTAREHLQRLALDLPRRVPAAGVTADGAWLRDMPLRALPDDADADDARTLQSLRTPLRKWLESQVLGGSADDWWSAWRQESQAAYTDVADGPLAVWARSRAQPVQRWLHAVRGAGRSLAVRGRPLDPARIGVDGWQALATRMALEDDFTRRPTWQGAPAETGCWTRAHGGGPALRPQNAWMRWQSRLAELVQIATSTRVLASGALPLGAGEGIAWSEMSRGLLVHWVRSAPHGGQATVRDCRVLAPTEWNFHPDGALARALAAPGLATDAVRAAVSALDACVEVDLPATTSEAGRA